MGHLVVLHEGNGSAHYTLTEIRQPGIYLVRAFSGNVRLDRKIMIP
jgi:hypothetical protein